MGARRLSVYLLLPISSPEGNVGEQQQAPTPAGIADRGCDTQALLGLPLLATAAVFFHSSSTPIFVTGDHTSSRLEHGLLLAPPGPAVTITRPPSPRRCHGLKVLTRTHSVSSKSQVGSGVCDSDSAS